MDKKVIEKAAEVISAKTGYFSGVIKGYDVPDLDGYAVLALIDENGYPTASTLAVAKADGIKWLTFATSPDSNKAKRIEKCNRASVCIASSEYNITLVGTIEIVTDLETKKGSWCDVMNDGTHWSGYDDSNFCVLRFNTERYNLFFADDGSEAAGKI